MSQQDKLDIRTGLLKCFLKVRAHTITLNLKIKLNIKADSIILLKKKKHNLVILECA